MNPPPPGVGEKWRINMKEISETAYIGQKRSKRFTLRKQKTRTHDPISMSEISKSR